MKSLVNFALVFYKPDLFTILSGSKSTCPGCGIPSEIHNFWILPCKAAKNGEFRCKKVVLKKSTRGATTKHISFEKTTFLSNFRAEHKSLLNLISNTFALKKQVSSMVFDFLPLLFSPKLNSDYITLLVSSSFERL